MFFKLAFLCSVLSCVFTAPAPSDVVPLEKQQPTVIPIVSQSEELEANGTYKYSYETGNGIKREEISYEKVIPKARGATSEEGGEDDDSNEIHVQQGSYSYVAPDGTVISVKYIADENGFQPVGDHLPRAPVSAPQSQSNSAEKSGRALKSDVKKDDSNKISSTAFKPESGDPLKEVAVAAEKEASADKTSTVIAEQASAETSANSVSEKSESAPQSAEEKTKARPEIASTEEAAFINEATTAKSDVPTSTTVSAEAALSTNAVTAEVASSTNAAIDAKEASTTEAASASDVASTSVAASAEVESKSGTTISSAEILSSADVSTTEGAILSTISS